MGKFSIINAALDIGVLAVGGWAVWLVGLVQGEVQGISLGLVLRIVFASVLTICLVWINVIEPEVRRRRAKQEAEAYAQSFLDQVDADGKRIDAMFNID